MGLLVEGKWQDTWYDTKSTGGKFIRQDSSFRNKIGEGNFLAEPNRYHLYVSYACPWAHRTLIFRTIKKLEDIISLTVVNPLMKENGWILDEDPVNNKNKLHEIYTLAKKNYTGRVTVPVLWDKKSNTIVNNESSEIIRIFNKDFNDITGNIDDYYPIELHKEIEEVNSFIYTNINNGVYKVGFATKQSVYENEVKKVFMALDNIEERLSKTRYLVGNVITESDWRLFTTLLRFDSVYVSHFKCNLKCISEYSNLSNYIRDLYQKPGIKETCNMDHIKRHYYQSHSTINPNAIVPLGPIVDYNQSHNRDRF